jgi:hypothetical protein
MGRGGTAPPFLTSALDGGEWSASRPDLFIPDKSPRTNWIRGWVDPRADLDAVDKRFFPCRESDPRSPARCYTN